MNGTSSPDGLQWLWPPMRVRIESPRANENKPTDDQTETKQEAPVIAPVQRLYSAHLPLWETILDAMEMGTRM